VDWDEELMPTDSTTLKQKWSRLKTAVRSVAAAIDTEPKHLASLKPMAEDALKLLSGNPSSEAIEEIDYLLQRVEQFVAKWRPSPRPAPGVLYMPPIWATSTDREAQEALRLLQEIRTAGFDTVDGQPAEAAMKVFISHGSADKKIAGAFIEFLRTALPLIAKDIRCTSVDGYKLPAGTNSDEQLRQEVFEAQAFLALLSPASLQSIYVMFELGARWGAKRYLAPVMIGGLSPSNLKAPLSAIHAVNGTSESDLHQLVETLSERLNIKSDKPAAYIKTLRSFIDESKVNLKATSSNRKRQNRKLTQKNTELKDEFVEARGALFKRKPGGGYHETVYCPSCKMPLSSFGGDFPYSCDRCKVHLDFFLQDLPTILKGLP
jgi:hypothetical protein